MYDRKKYLRSKKGVFKKALLPEKEEFRAYKIIRDKWDFDDRTINHWLQTHTVTEILEGEMTPSGFVPKENIVAGKYSLAHS